MSDHKGFTETDVPDQSGKCFIVTGANAGVGFELSRVLAARRARVLLGCREKARAEEAIARIKQQTPNANLAWLPLDLGDIESVRAAVANAVGFALCGSSRAPPRTALPPRALANPLIPRRGGTAEMERNREAKNVRAPLGAIRAAVATTGRIARGGCTPSTPRRRE